MDREIEEALRGSPDYSPVFSAEVSRLAELVRGVLGAPVEHVKDMNYSSSQRIVCGADASGAPARSVERAAVAEVVAYVSSRAKLFAVLVFKSMPTTRAAKEWSRPTEASDQLGVARIIDVMSSILEAEGYRRLSGPVLGEVVAGRETEMDGTPATVFDVIFTEVV